MNNTTNTKVTELFRYEAWSGYGDKNIVLREFKIQKETPCGFWVYDSKIEARRWIGKNTYRPHAFKTKEEALKSFIHRKLAYLKILETKKQSTIQALDIIKTHFSNPKPEQFECVVLKS